jgi:hypothetical protein
MSLGYIGIRCTTHATHALLTTELEWFKLETSIVIVFFQRQPSDDYP